MYVYNSLHTKGVFKGNYVYVSRLYTLGGKKLNKDNIRLTTTEITNLLTQYEQETMYICICKYVLATVKDSQIRSLFKFTLDLSEKHLKKQKDFFKKESYPVPKGFTEKDVNLHAPPLFTDSFWLEFLFALSHLGLSGYGLALSVSVRRDIRDYYYQCNLDAMEVYNKTVETLLSTGMYEPTPSFETPKRIEYITSLGYTLDVIGKKRPLNSAEAGHIYSNLKTTCMAKGLCLGFYQVAKNKEVRQFLEKTLTTINKNYSVFSSLLREDNLRVPQLLDTQVTNSTVSPFSDKLMMFKVGFLLGISISYYGTALVSSMRADIVGHCEVTILRNLKLQANWGNIAINHGWLTKLPEANDRKVLP